jgi:hypothetical protein
LWLHKNVGFAKTFVAVLLRNFKCLGCWKEIKKHALGFCSQSKLCDNCLPKWIATDTTNKVIIKTSANCRTLTIINII